MVLPTAGAAEASTLIARGLTPRHPVVIHPQFTEPEAALRRAGIDVMRHLLRPDVGFVLAPDAVPGEQDSLIGPRMPGVLVVRSLTKTWGLAGVRAGYVVGDPRLVARLAAQQPPWAVSGLGLAAIEACLTEDALAQSRDLALTEQRHRDHLVAGLTALGVSVVLPPRAPFVLFDTGLPAGPGGSLHSRLARRGFAVRRGDTLPGLGPSWLRVAVRPPEVTDAFMAALATVF